MITKVHIRGFRCFKELVLTPAEMTRSSGFEDQTALPEAVWVGVAQILCSPATTARRREGDG